MEFSLRFAFMLVTTPLAMVMGIWRPFIGILCLVFLYYFRPDIWNAPLWFRPIFWITCACFVGWLTRDRKFRFDGIFGLSIVLLIAHLVSAIQASDRVYGIDCVWVIFKLMIVQFLAMQLIDRPWKMNLFLWTNVVGMAWSMKTILVVGLLQGGARDDFRVNVAVGAGGGANYLAMILVSFLPFIILKITSGVRWERRLAMVFGPVILLCIVLTGSRGGFLGLAVIMVHSILRSRRKFLAVAVTLLMAVIFFVSVPTTFLDRFKAGVSSNPDKRDFAAESRILLWKAAIEMWKGSKLLGVGPDNFQLLSPQYAGFYASNNFEAYQPGVKKQGFVAHSTWMQTLAEGGVLSTVPLVGIFILAFVGLNRTKKADLLGIPDGATYHLHAVALEGMIIAMMIGSTFGSHIKLDPLWWVLGSVSALNLNYSVTSGRARELAWQAEIMARRVGSPAKPSRH